MDSGQTLAALKCKSIVICLNTIRKMSVIAALETKIKDMERTKLMLLEKQAKHTQSKTDFETQARTAKITEPFQLIQRLRGGMLVHNIEAYAMVGRSGLVVLRTPEDRKFGLPLKFSN